jgi:hypothetical protein
MTQGTLLPNPFEVKLICLRPKDGAIQMELQACRTSSACPLCGTPSGRVHSRYTFPCNSENLPVDGSKTTPQKEGPPSQAETNRVFQ